MLKPKVDELSPDGFSRFYILIDILRELYASRRTPITILDVGGGSEFMQQQLDALGLQYELTIIDIIERPKRVNTTYVQGDATAMTFPDDSFDVVLSTDVLEHVFPKKKQAFLNECLRVSKDVCIIAAPFETEGVHEAEVVVNEFNKKLFGTGQDWLEEHLNYGKPTREMFLKTLRKQKVPFTEFGTQNLAVWLLNTHLNLIDAKLGLPTKAHVAINRFYNQNILEMGEFQAPTYRHFFIMYTGASFKRRFDASRYEQAQTDHKKTSQYTSDLLNLTAQRIAEQQKTIQKLEADQKTLRQQAHEKRSELEATIANQQETLKKMEPVLKLAHNRVIRKAYGTVKKLRK